MIRYKSVHRGGRVVGEHIAVAERALGRRLPPGAEVHHVDGNKRNNANSNLVICQDKAYHMLLHVRASIVKAGGNPNTDRYCGHCRTVKPATEFSIRARRQCRPCRATLQLAWWRKKKSADQMLKTCRSAIRLKTEELRNTR